MTRHTANAKLLTNNILQIWCIIMTGKSGKSGDFTHLLKILENISNNQTGEKNYDKKIDLSNEGLRIDRDKISRELFFICGKCNGPLIQYTFCRICKKTTSRVCAKCGMIRTEGDHKKCLFIMFIDVEKTRIRQI